jgi:hypothetical protein
MERLTTRHCDKAVIKDKSLLAKAMEKLAHYEDLEEQGLLLKLPCKVGSELYCVSKKNSDGRREVISTTVNNIMESFCYADAIGKGMYLTKSEAEKALAEMEK